MAGKLSLEQIEQRRENLKKARAIFEVQQGKIINGHPVIDSSVYYTKKGTPYLKEPGVALISLPDVELEVMRGFLKGYGEELGFENYLDDPVKLGPGAQLIKVAGQECYASYGKGHTANSEADGYIDAIKKDEHGSVLAHPQYSFLVYGISRSVSHEWVRHGIGTTYSQRSQRYVSEKVLRFVERPEYQKDPELHESFEARIDATRQRYKEMTRVLLSRQKSGESQILSAEAKTDLRKKIQQASRSVLTNETETSFVTSLNVRALQHIINMRTSEHAETEIREPFLRILVCLMMIEPRVFADFEIREYPDGTRGASSPYKKP